MNTARFRPGKNSVPACAGALIALLPLVVNKEGFDDE
jgi:hypothetical protein